MNRRRKSVLLWGVIGGLTFLVLLQGFELATGRLVDPAVKAGVTVVVAAGAAGVAAAIERRRPTGNERT